MRSNDRLSHRLPLGPGDRVAVLLLFAMVNLTVLFPAGEARARYASIVIDAGTGEVLHQTNADTRNYPASLTKMMTLYLAFEALSSGRLRMDQSLSVSRRAAGISPSKLGLRRGEKIRVRKAWRMNEPAAGLSRPATLRKRYNTLWRPTTIAPSAWWQNIVKVG